MRKRFTKIAFSAAFVLAMAFTLSCSSGDDNSPGDNGGNPGTGGNANVVYGPDVPYQGETYKTVKIGTQTWFQRNLNYAVAGSKCGNGSSLSDANTSTCDTYGRLYNWATAMKLDASCNTSSCASQVGAKHQGICPSGWHIPSNADWDRLYRSADGTSGTSSHYSSPTAGRYLKARDGWDSGGNGEDTFGFSALPGGRGDSDGNFLNVGIHGYWWSASAYTSDSAYDRYMYYYSERAVYGYYDKDYLFSVRCLQD